MAMEIKQLSRLEEGSPASTGKKPTILGRINIIKSVKRHLLVFAAVTLSILAVSAVFLLRHRSNYYEATSVVYVSPTFPATLASDREHEYPYDSYIEEQAHSITRYDVIAAALKRVGPGMWQRPNETEDQAVVRLQREIEAKRDGLTYEIEITLGGYNPVQTTEIVNAVTNSFLDKAKSEEFYGRDSRLDALRAARAEVQKELNEKLKEQASISQDLGVAVIGDDRSDELDAQVAQLKENLTKARQERIEAEARLSALVNGDVNAPNPALDAAADKIIATDPSLVALKTSLSTKRSQLIDQLAALTPNHPVRKATEQQLAEIESELQKMKDSLRQQAAHNLEEELRTELKRTQTVEAKLLSDLQSYTSQATNAAPKFQRAAVLTAEINTLQARYATLDERTHNLELESSSPGSVHIFSEARVPSEPKPSKVKTFGPVLFPLAFLFGLCAVVAIDVLDPHLYSDLDVERVLGFPPIGVIFDERDVTMQIFDEYVLRLAAGIDQAIRTAGIRTVVLTAVHPGAGTTSLVESLGSTLARLGRKTLTIDASGASAPVAYVTLSLHASSQGPGFPIDEKDRLDLQPADVVTHTFTPRLTPLTSFMDRAFKELTTEYEIILVDATPLLISAETEYLARHADLTILVSEAGKTTGPQLGRCARVLERLQVASVAAILNKISLDRLSKDVRQDLTVFEARTKSENLAWKPVWNQGTSAEPEFGGCETATSSTHESFYA